MDGDGWMDHLFTTETGKKDIGLPGRITTAPMLEGVKPELRPNPARRHGYKWVLDQQRLVETEGQ